MSDYDADFHRWIEEQTAFLESRQLDRLDVPHLIEELEGMSARERRELINRLALLLAHLLKCEYQPERRCNSWRYTINEQRRQIAMLLEDSPSLEQRLGEFLSRGYLHACRAALEETGFLGSPFPRDCAYSVAEVLDETFWPGNAPAPVPGAR